MSLLGKQKKVNKMSLDHGQNWDNLPLHLWEEIYWRWVMSDQIRFASVSKAHASSITFESENMSREPDPWLIFTGEDYGRVANRKYDFLCLSDKRLYGFDQIIPDGDCEFLGSSNGWVLTRRRHPDCSKKNKDRPLPKMQYMLVHPILNAQLILARWSIYSMYWKGCYKRTLLVTETPEETALVLLTEESGLLYFIRGNRPISTIRLSPEFCKDVVFHRGKYYALSTSKRGKFTIHVFSYELGDSRRDYVVEGIVDKSTKDRAAYLVECGEHVLIMLIGAHDNDDNGHGEEGSLKHMLLAGCEIYKILFTDGGGSAKAVRLQSLGGHALFLDRGGCKSLPVGRYSRYSLFKEDHIYFIPILQKGTSLHDYGVYSLKDESIKQFPNIPSCIPTPQVSYWYFPTKKKDAFVDKEENSPQPPYW